MGKTLLYGLGKGDKTCKLNTKSCPMLLLAFFHLALLHLWKGGPALLEIFFAVNWLLCLFYDYEPVKSWTCKAWWITRESQPWIICTPFIHVSDQVQRWQEKQSFNKYVYAVSIPREVILSPKLFLMEIQVQTMTIIFYPASVTKEG